MPPLVSFIVVNWNGEAYLEDCLCSISEQSYAPLELIVVDNGSSDRSMEILGRRNGIDVVRNESNLGFGPANNQGIARARGEFIALINNDTVLHPDWLRNIVQPLLQNESAGMAAGKTLNFARPDLIDNTGHLLYWDGINRGRGRMQKDQGQFDTVREALLPSGCAAVFRASMLQQIGTFDEDFFLYGEDTELGMRGRLSGWECPFVPNAVAYHRYSSSTAPYHPMKFFFVERNRFWIVLKYFPMELILLNPVFCAARYLYHAIAMLRGKGVTGEFARNGSSWSLLGLLIRAQWSAWKKFPQFWRKRRELQHKCHWSRRRFYRCFLPHRLGLRELAFTP